jgi:myo-inositol-1(or 4)-monophosphatase
MFDRIEQVASSAIQEAGKLIRDRLGSVPFAEVQTKAPFDYVTEVDHASEALITGAIRRVFPDHHIMSEESDNDGLQNGITWVIDPLDGTVNFIHTFPFVAISIAVCLDREPLLGWVLDPLHGELFTAKRGGGAYLNGRRLQVSNVKHWRDALVGTGFPHRMGKIIDPYLNCFRAIFQEVSGIRRAGSAALDLAYLAAGRMDAFWEVGLKAWDIAAGALLVREAGGYVTDFWGMEDYLENGHVVCGTAQLYPFMLHQVQTHLAPALVPGSS